MIIDTSMDRQMLDADRVRRPVPFRHPFLLMASVLYLLVLVALWIVLRWQGERWWVATLLLLSPRWPFALPLPLLVGWIVWRRAWGHCVWPIAAACLLAFPILGVRANIPTAGSERPGLRLLSCNVHRQQVDAGELLALIAREKPDVVALQDWSETNDAVFAPLGGETSSWHRHREGELLVASRFPIRSIVPLEFPDMAGAPKAERGAAAGFELMTPHGPVWIVNVHFASPHSGLETFREDGGAGLTNNSDRRWGQSEQTLGFVETLRAPVIITGDFNTVDDSPLFREHWSEYTDAFSELGYGLGYTYLVTHTQIRIDHVLGNGWVRFSHFRLHPRIGSPHRPMVAEMDFLAPEGQGQELAEAEIERTPADSHEAGSAGGR